MEYREAQEGIARGLHERCLNLHVRVTEWLTLSEDDRDLFLEDADALLAVVFTPKQIEEWKKGGYPAIVCKDQSLPRGSRAGKF